MRLTKGRWDSAFLVALATCGNVTEACKAVSISRWTAYERKKRDLEFSDRWETALQDAADALEREAWRRAHEGVEEPVYYKGRVVGHVRKYSDLLLMFLLKGLRPERYRERVMLSPGELDKMIEQALAERQDGAEAVSEAVN